MAENGSSINSTNNNQEASDKDNDSKNHSNDNNDKLENSFPVVGIGASAGGLDALEKFFSAMPTDKDIGMAFVVVQHLAPDHKSMLSEIIERYTSMEVSQVKDGMAVDSNHVYIIPPNRDMIITNGILHLMEPAQP
ncbi:MAG: hypothetical protein AWU59_2687, partial [Methanolobus sp. T82-4]